MSKYSNEVATSTASVRRTLKLPDYETITIELPISPETHDPELNFWYTVAQVNSLLIQWATMVAMGHQANIGKGCIDRIVTEQQLAQARIQQLKTT